MTKLHINLEWPGVRFIPWFQSRHSSTQIFASSTWQLKWICECFWSTINLARNPHDRQNSKAFGLCLVRISALDSRLLSTAPFMEQVSVSVGLLKADSSWTCLSQGLLYTDPPPHICGVLFNWELSLPKAVIHYLCLISTSRLVRSILFLNNCAGSSITRLSFKVVRTCR